MFNGQLLRRLREQKQLSARDFAVKIGISRSYVNLIELGQKEPSVRCRQTIASFFDRPIADFQMDEQDGTTRVQPNDQSPEEMYNTHPGPFLSKGRLQDSATDDQEKLCIEGDLRLDDP